MNQVRRKVSFIRKHITKQSFSSIELYRYSVEGDRKIKVYRHTSIILEDMIRLLVSTIKFHTYAISR
jgi:hypothetical protein